MNHTNLNLEGIAEPARAGTRALADALQQALEGSLLGLTVFGSAVTGEFGPRCRVRSVAVLEKVDMRAMARLASQGARLGQHRVEAPLVMTPRYVRESLDAFPVEFLEIQQAHHTVLGEDIFCDLEFRDEDLRLQCEREFKRMLIRLRQGLLAAEGKTARLGALLDDLSGHAGRVLRSVLRLKGDRRPLPPSALLTEAGRALELDLSALDRIGRPATPATLDDIERVYGMLEDLAERINEM
jgi:hypothetical protein